MLYIDGMRQIEVRTPEPSSAPLRRREVLPVLLAPLLLKLAGCSRKKVGEALKSQQERVRDAGKALEGMGAEVQWIHPESGETSDPLLILGHCHDHPGRDYNSPQHRAAVWQEFLGLLAAADAGVRIVRIDGLRSNAKYEMAATGILWQDTGSFQLLPYPLNKELRAREVLDPDVRKRLNLTINGRKATVASPEVCRRYLSEQQHWDRYIDEHRGEIDALDIKAFTAAAPHVTVTGAEDPEKWEEFQKMKETSYRRAGTVERYTRDRKTLPDGGTPKMEQRAGQRCVVVGGRLYPASELFLSLQHGLGVEPEEQAIHRRREHYACSLEGDLYFVGFDHLPAFTKNAIEIPRSLAVVTLPESKKYIAERDAHASELPVMYQEIQDLLKGSTP